ncbi:hypothetical protein O9929_10450 [Vibrio lentus]|nr:hypothetical protein [Vibrio lentus]
MTKPEMVYHEPSKPSCITLLVFMVAGIY